eukprot:GHRQ01020862.1.p2 GENE.GHRQ01020862.1~~GHRQ01020862.1.p2  ORF type:complete len:112 (-),score=25.40 GHRQ01020862.1:159-494(-)
MQLVHIPFPVSFCSLRCVPGNHAAAAAQPHVPHNGPQAAVCRQACCCNPSLSTYPAATQQLHHENAKDMLATAKCCSEAVRPPFQHSTNSCVISITSSSRQQQLTVPAILL